MIDPTFHGKGFGTTILNLGIEKLKSGRTDVKAVRGLVQPLNIASIKIFEKLGFVKFTTSNNILKVEKELY